MQDSLLMQPVPEVLSGSPTRESTLLDQCLQSEFNEQIARIFDESLYTDLELSTGRFELKTHTCILKARTPYFYEKIEELLQVKFNRELYDEIYSFVSDIYTDCDLRAQEKELLETLETIISNHNLVLKKNTEKATIFNSKGSDSSPSIEINKEYYALVQVDSNLVNKEIDEQNYLSSAFHSIIKSQSSVDQSKPLHFSNPNYSSHSSKNFAHSTDCDNKLLRNHNKSINDFTPSSHISDKSSESFLIDEFSNSNNDFQVNFSPDSLIADDTISVSEYCYASNDLSESYINNSVPSMNYSRNFNTMDNVSDSIDSGVENTGIFEDLIDSKEVSLQTSDLSRLHGSAIDIPNNDKQPSSRIVAPPQHLMLANTSFSKNFKEQKEHRNADRTVLESSSLSSETGSWESVFPQKSNANANQDAIPNSTLKLDQDKKIPIQYTPTSKTKVGAIKSTVCFIDAASLVDDDDVIKNKKPINIDFQRLPAPSEPLPCSTIKIDLSPNDVSESNDNDDSLEQPDAKDADSLQNDISPTIFDLALTTDTDNEDTLATKPFDKSFFVKSEALKNQDSKSDENFVKTKTFSTKSIFLSTTPHNSILSLQCTSKAIDSEDGDSDSTVRSHDTHRSLRKIGKFADSSPIVSGGASIEDHLPQKCGYMSSPLASKRLDNKPIVSTSYAEQAVKATLEPSVRSGVSSSWIVDMSRENVYLTKDNNSVKSSNESIRPKNKNVIHHSSVSSENCLDSDSSDRSSEKFYIDLSSLPDSIVTNKDTSNSVTQKKNIFSMYIDLRDDSTTLKERPTRLSSSVNMRKKIEPSLQSNNPTVNQIAKAEKNKMPAQPDASFEDYEELCKNPDMSISEILTISDSSNKSEVNFKIDEKTNVRHKDYKVIQDKHFIDASIMSESFVRLSDLDKPSSIIVDVTKSADSADPNIRMTRSIPNTLWDEQSHKGARSSEVISSFHSENALSLNRLFPHLKNEFSRSMPGSLSNRTRSPFRIAEHVEIGSDISELSSVQSSYCRSVVENSTTTDDSQSQTSSLISNCQSKLGQDLLRMFLEEIAPDVIVEVKGRRFKAHKCILSSRCQFFAGFLSGGWVESAGNVIILPPFSYNVVQFALCHIYSGLSTIPDSVSIVELAGLADMLGLEGLKEAIMFTLKAKYCHHFHKPCNVCIAGVLECFPLTSVYGLDELYRKCLKWITKYFHKVWPTKAFASLPKELVDKCYQYHVIEMSTDNVVDTVCLCGMTEAALGSARWAEVCRAACRRLQRTAVHFVAARLCAVLAQVAPLPQVLPPSASSALNACIIAAIQIAQLEEIDRSRNFLSKALKEMSHSKPDVISTGDHSARNERNSYLLSHAADWLAICMRNAERASPRVKKDLRAAKKPIHESPLRDLNLGSRATIKSKQEDSKVNIDHVRACFIPYAAKPNITKEQQQVSPRKKVVPREPPKIRTTKAQEERAKFNAALNNKECEPNHIVNTNYRNALTKAVGGAKKVVAGGKKAAGVVPARLGVSTSESSRGSSPVALLARNCLHSPRTQTVETQLKPVPINPNLYHTYTKAKRTVQPKKPSENMKTRIPVYQNNLKKAQSLKNGQASTSRDPTQSTRNPGSLLNATKSSHAKIVPKARKEPPSKPLPNKIKQKLPAIPVMERSETFLKDEPTFGDKTTKLDVGKAK